MEFDKVIQSRRTIRKFSSKPVEKEIIRGIVSKALQYAPSAAHRQPWRVLVVSDQTLKEKITRFCKKNTFIMDAPYFIIALANEADTYKVIGNYMTSEVMDISVLFTHIILGATDKGLGTCWTGAFEGAKLERLLGIAYPWRIAALTPIGYSLEEGIYKPRKPLSEVFEWIGE